MFGTDNYNICGKMLLGENVIGFFFLIRIPLKKARE